MFMKLTSGRVAFFIEVACSYLCSNCTVDDGWRLCRYCFVRLHAAEDCFDKRLIRLDFTSTSESRLTGLDRLVQTVPPLLETRHAQITFLESDGTKAPRSPRQ